jgi:dephospho-CoA kinase
MALVVGVTGGIGSGKSAATDAFAGLGVTIVDADIAARIIVEPGGSALDAIAAHFGTAILLPDGSLDRAALRKVVFADEAQRQWLEQLTHPLIGQEIRRQLLASTSPYSILSSPLLLETRQQDLADIIVLVDVPETVQLERATARDANTQDQIRRIMAAQMSREQRRELADIVIDNSGSLAQLEDQVRELHKEFLLRAETSG